MRKKKVRKKTSSPKKHTRRTSARKKKTVSRRRKTVRRSAVRKVAKPVLEPIGQVTHYFPHVKAGVVKVTKGVLALGDTVHIKGHTTDFKQKVASLQLDHQSIPQAAKGQEVGMGVKSRVRQNDLVYKL